MTSQRLNVQEQLVLDLFLGDRNMIFSRDAIARHVWGQSEEFPPGWKPIIYCLVYNVKKHLREKYNYSIRRYPRGQGWKLAHTDTDIKIATEQSMKKGGGYLKSAKSTTDVLSHIIETQKLSGAKRRDAERIIDRVVETSQAWHDADRELRKAVEEAEKLEALLRPRRRKGEDKTEEE